jgi:tetratricopeptide (TPR) repeat protein
MSPFHPRNSCLLRVLAKSLVAAVIVCASVAVAADPSINRLLSKLPPPEKFVDPAQNDPLAKQMAAAAKAHNFGIALEASRRLANKYPKSLGAHAVHGLIALAMRRYPEASAAYRKALSIRSDFSPGYFGLALAEASQNHFREAFSNFQQLTRLAPNAEIGWLGSSACAEKLGRRQDSLAYARRATVVAPASASAWYQLAREEGLFGDKQAAAKALARANRLQGSKPQIRSTRSSQRR